MLNIEIDLELTLNYPYELGLPLTYPLNMKWYALKESLI